MAPDNDVIAQATDTGGVSIASDPWMWWRDRMPVAGKYAYFDHAAVAPLSGPAAQAIATYTRQASTQGDAVWPEWSAKLDELRSGAATLLNVDRGEICLVPNTTTGINLVAEGFPWQPRDSVVVPDGEFPSNLFPWLNQRCRGVDVRVVPRRGAEVVVDDLIARIDDSTRIIAVSWVGYASGYRLDIADLVAKAHDRGVAVFLDAIQGLGMYPLDLQAIDVDFLAADGHKWLLGPEGAGVAMIRRRHLDSLRCGNVGWGSVKASHNYSDPRFDLRDDASRFESGSANMSGGAALAASVSMFNDVRAVHGDRAIADRVIESVTILDERLRSIGAVTSLPTDPNRRSGILNFNLPGVEPAEFRAGAMAENVVLSCRGGGVRASVHVYNDASDIDRLIDVARSFL